MKKWSSIVLTCAWILGLASPAFAKNLEDVPANHWAYEAVRQLQKVGIVEGYGDNTFKGDKLLTRYEMAAVVDRAMEKSNKADIANQALIEKLSREFNKELTGLNNRMTKMEKERFTMTGDLRLRWLSYNDNINVFPTFTDNSAGSFWQGRVRLNMAHQVSDEGSVFLRFAARNNFGNTVSDSYQPFDQYGVKFKTQGWLFSLGRQSVKLGGGMILGTGEDVEWNHQFDGLIASTQFGKTNFKILAGRTGTSDVMYNTLDAYHKYGLYMDNWDTPADWYGAELSGMVGKKLNLGAAYAYSKPQNVGTKTFQYYGANTNVNVPNYPERSYWSANATYYVTPRLTLSSEFATSNADVNNSAYVVGLGYSLTKRDYLFISYQNIGANAVDEKNTKYGAMCWPYSNGNYLMNGLNRYYYPGYGVINYGNPTGGYTGMLYWLQHTFSKNLNVSFAVMDLRLKDHGGADLESCLEFNYKF